MILIVGLGNPGEKFQKTRHNLGFLVLDELQKENNFPKWRKKFLSLISEGKISKKKILLVKPQTFMNDSGKAVKLLTINYKLPSNNLWIIHDDLDLSIGKIKISKDVGSASHKGVQSIIDAIKTRNFIRFRIGTQQKNKKNQKRESIVLKEFSEAEEREFKKVIQKAYGAIKMATEEGVKKAMTEFNKS